MSYMRVDTFKMALLKKEGRECLLSGLVAWTLYDRITPHCWRDRESLKESKEKEINDHIFFLLLFYCFLYFYFKGIHVHICQVVLPERTLISFIFARNTPPYQRVSDQKRKNERRGRERVKEKREEYLYEKNIIDWLFISHNKC